MSEEKIPDLLGNQLANGLMARRVVLLGEEVTDESANRVCAQLMLLAADDPERDITLLINSPGGSVTAGLGVYDTMSLIPNEVSTVALGSAYSMGQILLTVGAPGKRYALPHSRIMMHQGSAGIGGVAPDIEIQAANLRDTRDQIYDLLAEKTGQPRSVIEREADRDRWFNAQEARDFGIVDHILDSFADVLRLRQKVGA